MLNKKYTELLEKYEEVVTKKNEKSDFYNQGVFTLHGDEYTMSPYHVLWPIPADAIRANTLGHINQNKGYFGYDSNVPPLTEILK